MQVCKYIDIKTASFIFRLEKVDKNIFRIRRAVDENSFRNKSLMVLPSLETQNFTYEKKDNFISLETEKLKLRVEYKTSNIIFCDKDDNIILQEKTASIKKSNVLKNSVLQSFAVDPEEGLYGLGQYQDGVMNYQNSKVVLSQSNRTIAVPFLTSTKGYGILWDNNSWTEFEVSNGEESIYSEVADCIDYYFVYGENIDGAIKGYR